MRIKLTTHLVGTNPRRNWPAGTEVDLDDTEALRLIAAGQAESIVRRESLDTQAVREFRSRYRIAPDLYLERYPNGPNADIARKVLADG